ncbi:ammonium transporter [Phormidium sp. CCY1219]|uniref:ammonium transporter n=1 Tax=Phormidium sp. CCY1219 TaxID=2886104 RepID=UPI002D1F6886|nr:ammonium transporter [Phormidium sp. CCY1219]MEB3829580.1 ammonium transporter [Phormidium sp. CCY1219]
MTSKLRLNRKLKHQHQRRSGSRTSRRWRGERTYQQLKLAIEKLSPSWRACIPLATIIVLLWGYSAVAQAPPGDLPEGFTETQTLKVALDTMWVVVAAILVIFMNAGFGMLETGFCRQKNAVNILSKNLIVFALATVAFWAIGFGLMFGNGNDFIGWSGFFLAGPDNSPLVDPDYVGVFDALNWTGVPLAAKFLFQVAFAGTAATIVSGAVAERIKFVDFLIFSLLLVGIAYPLTGHWVWGGGWLLNLGFLDFAGSTVVHSVGGWAALMGAAFLEPRLGKYQDGRPLALPGHNMSLATLGCLILWIGWFGFNPGSTMEVTPSIAHIALTTNIAAATGGIAATIVAWMYLGTPDLSMIINGILAGLVAITAGCDGVTVFGAVIIGSIGGILVVFAVTFFDRIHIDDPVGAISVHLVNGIWGTLAVGLFNVEAGLFYTGNLAQLGIQILGIASIGGMTVLLASIFWLVLKNTLGIRVREDEELKGLDISEHGMEGYSGFLKDTRGMPGGS